MMLQVGEWTWELIICPLDILKNDFCEIDEAMFQGVELPLRTHVLYAGFRKKRLDEVECNDLSSIMALKTYNLP
jgi:hypothetical protein